METYPWFDVVPEHLKTRKQLAEQGLRPGGPVVARVVWRQGKRWADLYDVHTAKPKRVMTPAQQAALAKAQQALRTCPSCGTIFPYVLGPRWLPWRDCPTCEQRARHRAYTEAIQQARIWLRSPRTLLLDTETTDLDGYLVQLAIIDTSGAVLFDSLVNPEVPISPGAERVHGLTLDQLQDAPTFAQIADQVFGILRGRRIVTYNAAFDAGIFHNEVARHSGAEHAVTIALPGRWRCAMELYAEWYGDWSDYHQSYRWQPLAGGDHSALGDARACLAVLKRVAASSAEDTIGLEEGE